MNDLLALRIKKGDNQAFELLFRKYYVRLCGFSNKFLNDPEEAREVAQEVFIKIWEGREDIDPEKSLKSYLFKIAQNLSLNKLRKKKVETRNIEILKLVYLEHNEFSVYESLFAKELDKELTTAINSIPSKCKTVFELSRIDGLNYSQIADVLNISVKTVEAHITKALKTLRIMLKDYLVVIIIELIIRII